MPLRTQESCCRVYISAAWKRSKAMRLRDRDRLQGRADAPRRPMKDGGAARSSLPGHQEPLLSAPDRSVCYKHWHPFAFDDQRLMCGVLKTLVTNSLGQPQTMAFVTTPESYRPRDLSCRQQVRTLSHTDGPVSGHKRTSPCKVFSAIHKGSI